MQITPTDNARWRQLPEQGRQAGRQAGSALIPLHVWHTLSAARLMSSTAQHATAGSSVPAKV